MSYSLVVPCNFHHSERVIIVMDVRIWYFKVIKLESAPIKNSGQALLCMRLAACNVSTETENITKLIVDNRL